MKRILILFLALCASSFAQDTTARYVARKSTVLSSSSEKVTVQQPTSGAKIVLFDKATIYSTVACDFTLSQAGTAATTTTLTPTPLNRSAAATAVAFSSSNAGAGNTIKVYSVPAGVEVPINLSNPYLDNDGTAQNLSLASASVSGSGAASSATSTATGPASAASAASCSLASRTSE